ncbi:hypothetical protein ACP70R_004288 [Stipagrostis hirtigluma subsp. patula]
MAAASQRDAHHLEPRQRRPMCAVCTKPLRLCLCGRLRSPPVDNAVGVTVLQHAMEANHPLNSTRVARLGLRNLAVAQVTDVNHRARFVLTTLGAGPAAGGAAKLDLGAGRASILAACPGNHDPSDGPWDIGMQSNDAVRCEGEVLGLAMLHDGISCESDGKGSEKCDFDKSAPNVCVDLDKEGVSLDDSGEILNQDDALDGIFCGLVPEVGSVGCGLDIGESFGFEGTKSEAQPADFRRSSLAENKSRNSIVSVVDAESNHSSEVGLTCKVNGSAHPEVANVPEINGAIHHCNGIGNGKVEDGAALGKDWTMQNMDKCTIAYTEKELRIDIERGVKPKIRWLSRGPLGEAAVSNGFVVTKVQIKKSKLTGEVTEFEEFSITIPPKSALLFPCQRAISIDASGCQVQHLIVLDGTWAKAQRMYHENPWLQLLPHVKLESDRVSLYSEVRHEPRPGCLSTIESIVVAMWKLGEDSKGLDDLLNVFESMIADQRRCKDENWKEKQKS